MDEHSYFDGSNKGSNDRGLPNEAGGVSKISEFKGLKCSNSRGANVTTCITRAQALLTSRLTVSPSNFNPEIDVSGENGNERENRYITLLILVRRAWDEQLAAGDCPSTWATAHGK